LSDMEKRVYEAFKNTMKEELANSDYQEELKKAVTEGHEGYREKVEREEDNPELVQKRMLTESPILVQQKLKFDGKNVDVDWEAHETSRRKKEFHKW